MFNPFTFHCAGHRVHKVGKVSLGYFWRHTDYNESDERADEMNKPGSTEPSPFAMFKANLQQVQQSSCVYFEKVTLIAVLQTSTFNWF